LSLDAGDGLSADDAAVTAGMQRDRRAHFWVSLLGELEQLEGQLAGLTGEVCCRIRPCTERTLYLAEQPLDTMRLDRGQRHPVDARRASSRPTRLPISAPPASDAVLPLDHVPALRTDDGSVLIRKKVRLAIVLGASDLDVSHVLPPR